jgi:RNA polymerase sigma factor (sigma-70 family)
MPATEAPASGDPPLTVEQQALVRSVDGLVESRVAWHVARWPAAVHLADDLVSAGKREVTETSRRYSAKFGTTFKTYVRYAVDGAIVDAIAQEARQQKIRIAGEACLRVGAFTHPPADEDTLDPLVDDDVAADVKLRRAMGDKMMGAVLAFALHVEELVDRQMDPERTAALRGLVAALRGVLSHFSARDQEMLRCLYALGMDLGEVAERFGLAYPTVKVRHAKILGRLREDLAALGFSSSSGGE